LINGAELGRKRTQRGQRREAIGAHSDTLPRTHTRRTAPVNAISTWPSRTAVTTPTRPPVNRRGRPTYMARINLGCTCILKASGLFGSSGSPHESDSQGCSAGSWYSQPARARPQGQSEALTIPPRRPESRPRRTHVVAFLQPRGQPARALHGPLRSCLRRTAWLAPHHWGVERRRPPKLCL
jgi:hypothetical protein